MKKSILFLLVFALLTFGLAACSAPEELNRTTILATWEGQMSLEDVLGVDVSVPVTFQFTEGGVLKMGMEMEDVLDAVKKLLEEGDAETGIMGISKAQLDQMAALSGKTVDELLEDTFGTIASTYSYPYLFDGTNLTINNNKVPYTYADGILVLTMGEQELQLEYVG